jgi:hypothetical protein
MHLDLPHIAMARIVRRGPFAGKLMNSNGLPRPRAVY